jgi:hypothetical protein
MQECGTLLVDPDIALNPETKNVINDVLPANDYEVLTAND